MDRSKLKFKCWNGKIMFQMKAILLDKNKYKQLKNNKSVIRQFSGMYDKYDNEIYEGDIIKFKRLPVIPSVLVKDELVEYIIVVPTITEHEVYFNLKLHAKDIEIIGNIHQTPHLIP